MKLTTVVLQVFSSVLLVACATTPQQDKSSSAAGSIACGGMESASSPQQAARTIELRRSVESEKLFTIPASAGIASCSVKYADAATQIEYLFKAGGTLTVKRDMGLEYSEQSAHFSLDPSADASAILQDAERHAFGPQGCGIDWQHSGKEAAENDPKATDTVFRGDTCNCQARMRRVPQSGMVWLVLRSAC
jgi:hypothetical protein